MVLDCTTAALIVESLDLERQLGVYLGVGLLVAGGSTCLFVFGFSELIALLLLILTVLLVLESQSHVTSFN